MRCTGSNERSVATSDDFFGHAIQRPPSGSSRFWNVGKRRASSARRVTKKTTTSRRPRAFVRSCTPGGSSSDSAKPLGAETIASLHPSLTPSFFARGVPEYPAIAVKFVATVPPRPPSARRRGARRRDRSTRACALRLPRRAARRDARHNSRPFHSTFVEVRTYARNDETIRRPIMAISLGQEAPNFTAETTEGKLDFHEYLGDSWGVLFSHPKDFTPVCTTELGRV